MGSRIIVFSGLPGSGKSTLAREVARRGLGAWLRVDSIENAVLEAGLARSFETGLAAYIGAREIARDNLQAGLSVVIDAVNGVEPARQMWRDLAHEVHAERYNLLVECTDPLEHRRRVESRVAVSPYIPLLTWEEVRNREFVPWDEPVLKVDTVRSLQENVDAILAYCSRGTPPLPDPS